LGEQSGGLLVAPFCDALVLRRYSGTAVVQVRLTDMGDHMARIRLTTVSAAAAGRMVDRLGEDLKAAKARLAAHEQLIAAAYTDPDGASARLHRYLAEGVVDDHLICTQGLARRAMEGETQWAAVLEQLTAQFADHHDHLPLTGGEVQGWVGLPRIAYARAESSAGAQEICTLMEILVPGMDARCPDWLAPLLRNDSANPAPWASLGGIALRDPRYRDSRFLKRVKKLDKKLASRG
jgi:hypothetical protein